MTKRTKVPEGGYRMSATTRERYEAGFYNQVMSRTRRMLDRAGIKHAMPELPGERAKKKRAERDA